MAVVATTMATTAGFAAPSHVAQMDMNSAHLAIMVAMAVATAVATITEVDTAVTYYTSGRRQYSFPRHVQLKHNNVYFKHASATRVPYSCSL